MTATEELLAIAQVSVTLVGFSGLVSAFRARVPTELEARDLSGLAVIGIGGSIALAFSLLPLPLAYLKIGEAAVWRICSGVFAATLGAGAAAFAVVNRRLSNAGFIERTPRVNRVTLGLASAAAVLLALGAFGVFRPGPAAYLTALIVCLVVCLTYVVAMLIIRRRE